MEDDTETRDNSMRSSSSETPITKKKGTYESLDNTLASEEPKQFRSLKEICEVTASLMENNQNMMNYVC